MEILAPCGSPEHIKAAVYAGADAVYLGGRGFSARRNAVNFSTGELCEAGRFCRSFGVKMYVTVNILTRDGEWDELCSYLTELADAAPDALIVQDIGVARLCRSILPGLPLHASTQMSVHSPEGVRFCEELGFTRVVIARECSQSVLADIVRQSGIGIEAFVHGALCVSVSGQCGLSAMIGGRSGNRGLCAQPCRLDFAGGGRSYALSLKDLSLIEVLPLLKEAGICALKIEGRMKRPEYVAAAVHAVRAALAGEEPRLDDLRAVFSRGGFTKGYFTGDHSGMSGVRSREDVLDTAAVLPRLAELYRTPSKLTPLDLCLTAKRNQHTLLAVTDGSDTVSITGKAAEEALSRETKEADAVRLLSRLGGTPFEAAAVRVELDSGLFLSASQINALRREACELLLERRIERLTPRYAVSHAAASHSHSPPKCTTANRPYIRVHCQTAGQARAVMNDAEQIVLPPDVIKTVQPPPDKVIIAPDRFIIDEAELKKCLSELHGEGYIHLLAENPAHAVIGKDFTLHGGLGLNVFNSQAADFWAEYGFIDLTASTELTLSDTLALRGAIPAGLIVYGRLPLMLLRRCPFERDCAHCPGGLTDRTKRFFPVRCRGGYQELLNADTLWMADKLPALRGAEFLSLLLHDETPEEALAVVSAYRTGGCPPDGFTRGLLYRRVE